jgi:hypothetical protein
MGCEDKFGRIANLKIEREFLLPLYKKLVYNQIFDQDFNYSDLFFPISFPYTPIS